MLSTPAMESNDRGPQDARICNTYTSAGRSQTVDHDTFRDTKQCFVIHNGACKRITELYNSREMPIRAAYNGLSKEAWQPKGQRFEPAILHFDLK